MESKFQRNYSKILIFKTKRSSEIDLFKDTWMIFLNYRFVISGINFIPCLLKARKSSWKFLILIIVVKINLRIITKNVVDSEI